jgi:histone deacetylase HOS3
MSTDMPDPATTAIYLQNACLSHKYIRNSDVSTVVERPERIRAVKLGLAAAIARLEEIITPTMHEIDVKSVQSAPLQSLDDFSGDLVVALEQMKLSSPRPQSASSNTPVKVVNSLASARLLDNAAIKYIHGDIDGDVYLENLVSWAKSSEQKVAEEASEIPEGYSQGDLFCRL